MKTAEAPDVALTALRTQHVEHELEHGVAVSTRGEKAFAERLNRTEKILSLRRSINTTEIPSLIAVDIEITSRP